MSRLVGIITFGSMLMLGVYMLIGAPDGTDKYQSTTPKTFISSNNPNEKKTFNDVLKEAGGIK